MTTTPDPPRPALRRGDPVWVERRDGPPWRATVASETPWRPDGGEWFVRLVGCGDRPFPIADLAPRVVSLWTLLADARATRARIADLLADAAGWNAGRPDAPVDPDPGGAMARLDAELARLVGEYERRIDDGQT